MATWYMTNSRSPKRWEKVPICQPGMLALSSMEGGQTNELSFLAKFITHWNSYVKALDFTMWNCRTSNPRGGRRYYVFRIANTSHIEISMGILSFSRCRIAEETFLPTVKPQRTRWVYERVRVKRWVDAAQEGTRSRVNSSVVGPRLSRVSLSRMIDAVFERD